MGLQAGSRAGEWVLLMIRFRIRLRFRKRDNIRWISHHDLVRTFERWFRRAGLPVCRSQGFHPKPKLSFPLALAVGIAACDEVLEFDTTERLDLAELRERLDRTALPGLHVAQILAISQVEARQPVQRVAYELPIPAACRSQLAAKISQWHAADSHWHWRVDSREPVDLRAAVDQLELHDGTLRFRLAIDRARGPRPREVLQALGVARLESEGCCLTRTRVELAVAPHNSNEEREDKSHEEGNVDQRVTAGGVSDRDR